MQEKKCSKCDEIKEINLFNKHSYSPDGFRCDCRECQSNHMRYYLRTKDGLATSMYSGNRRSSRDRGMNSPSYTKEEFKKWLFSRPNFDKLFNDWINSDCDKNLTPSVDRKDDYKSYTFSNIRLVTWKDNNNKGYSDRRNGINNKHSTAVVQLNMDGSFVADHYSMQNARRLTGCDNSDIGRCCEGVRNKVGGFKWMYAEEYYAK